MAEMTAAEALGILGGSEKQPQSEQELITSIIAGMTRGEKCFVLLWDSERVQIAALIEQQAAEIAKKDRMIEKIYKPLQDCDCKGEKAKCDVLDKGLYPWDLCEYYWLCEIEWLEKEAEGVE